MHRENSPLLMVCVAWFFLTCQCPKTPPNFDVNLAKLLETHEQEIADRRASAINLEHLVHELNEERRAKNDEILRLKVLS